MNNNLTKRFTPLYIASFSQGLVFWYAIEKVFMTGIGFKPSTIVLVSIIWSVTGLLLEVPSGIVADRWSRKGILIISCVAFMIGSLLLGLSHNVLTYSLVSILIGIHFALYSGMYDSIIYDTLIEETGSRKNYEKYYGNVTVLATLGIATGGLMSGVIGKRYGLSVDYFLSIPGSIISIFFLYKFNEPRLHRAVAKTKIIHQFRDTLKIVTHTGDGRWILISIVAFDLVLEVILQVGQLWALAVALPLVLYGPLDALLLIGYGIGASVAKKLSKGQIVLGSAVIGAAATILLTFKNTPLLLLAQFTIVLTFSAIIIVLSGRLHDNLPSHLRSGSSSIIGTLKTLLLIPLIFSFGVVTQRGSVFSAAYIVIALAIIGLVTITKLTLGRTDT